MSPKRGVMYAAYRPHFIAEVARSVKSLKRHNDLPVTLYADEEVSGPWDDVRPLILEPDYARAKAKAMRDSPYQRTLFLDSDTYITGDITSAFDVLDRYDFAASYAPRRWGRESGSGEAPIWFPEICAGVMYWRKGARIDNFFNIWSSILDQQESEGWYGRRMVQPGLRVALYRSKVQVFILPPEYDTRIPTPAFISTKVLVIHGRGEQLEAAIENINRHHNMRVWLPLENDLYDPPR